MWMCSLWLILGGRNKGDVQHPARHTLLSLHFSMDYPDKIVWLLVPAGTFSGTGEAAYYLANLQGARKVPAGATACANATVGRMMRQNIAVIVTGEAH
jgi:hypothetical protein